MSSVCDGGKQKETVQMWCRRVELRL